MRVTSPKAIDLKSIFADLDIVELLSSVKPLAGGPSRFGQQQAFGRLNELVDQAKSRFFTVNRRYIRHLNPGVRVKDVLSISARIRWNKVKKGQLVCVFDQQYQKNSMVASLVVATKRAFLDCGHDGFDHLTPTVLPEACYLVFNFYLLMERNGSCLSRIWILNRGVSPMLRQHNVMRRVSLGILSSISLISDSTVLDNDALHLATLLFMATSDDECRLAKQHVEERGLGVERFARTISSRKPALAVLRYQAKRLQRATELRPERSLRLFSDIPAELGSEQDEAYKDAPCRDPAEPNRPSCCVVS